MKKSVCCTRSMSTMSRNAMCVRRGFALPMVIFLMVVVSLLLGFMVRFSQQQSASVDLALLASRADFAARSASEWASYQVTMTEACPGPAPDIAGFDISVDCAVSAYDEASPDGSNNRFRYDLVIQAETAGMASDAADYAYRSLALTLVIEK